jgi:hypothetical protein
LDIRIGIIVLPELLLSQELQSEPTITTNIGLHILLEGRIEASINILLSFNLRDEENI